MKKQYKLGVIGCGFMGVSILRGVVLSDFIRERKIIVSDISEEKLDGVNYLGVRTSVDNKYVAENSEFLVFAVKPKDFDAVVKSLDGYCPEKVISVMDGVSKNTIKNSLGIGMIKVARAIPNMPCSIGSGVVGLDLADYAKNMDDTDFIFNIFNNIGTVVDVDASKLNAVSAVGASSPSFVYMFIESLIAAGVKQGLTKDEAKIIAVQTVLGSAELVSRGEQSLDELLLQASNRGGKVLEGIKVLENNNMRSVISDAVAACTNDKV